MFKAGNLGGRRVRMPFGRHGPGHCPARDAAQAAAQSGDGADGQG